MSFTANDTPDIIRRINDDLADITETVRAADSALSGLILTGAFARGEGSVRDGQPQNDYDLVALRRVAPPPRAYRRVCAELEARLGLHIDLAPVSTWRLRHVRPSIFWYETALRGRVLYGPNLLDRIPIRQARHIEPREGLRLLVNRSAGLLLATRDDATPHEKRLQASKGLLAALDAQLLAEGHFAPTQTERWALWRATHRRDHDTDEPHDNHDWFKWAYQSKVDPDNAGIPDPDAAWRAAAHAIRNAVPIALQHAGLDSLKAYEAGDGLVDRLYFLPRLVRQPGLWRVAWHPTGHVRVRTLRMLLAQIGHADQILVHGNDAGPVNVHDDHDELDTLENLRHATLQ